MARMNDTRALTERAPRGDQHHSVSTEKIDNGWLTRHSTCTGTGEYKSSTTFSSEPPRIRPPTVGRMPRTSAAGNESVEDATNYLGRK